MLNVFGMQQGGSQYRRLIVAFQRAFGATIFFGRHATREGHGHAPGPLQLHARGAHLVLA